MSLGKDEEGPDMTEKDWRLLGVFTVVLIIAVIYLVGMWLG